MSKRWTATGAAAGAMMGAVAGLVGAGYYWLLRRPLPRTRGTLRLEGLQNPVEVLRDRWGVPHIYSETIPDLMYAQGFVHAQDRLWQMEFSRRLVAGRLSEVLGAETVSLDRWMRTLTMRRVAEQEVGLLDDETRTALEAYAAGVNARIAKGRLPVEFTLVRHKPEPWQVADSLSWIKMMSWILSVNWETEILRARLVERLGPELAAELESGYPDDMPRILSDLSGVVEAGAEAAARAEAARKYTGPAADAGLGSNNWVVSGLRTATGMPLLANDMHLQLSMPSIWYENHLIGGDLNVTGVSFPGLPGVVSGHNGHVAWGFTNGFPDVQDLYIEHLRQEEGRWQYEFQGEWHDARVHREEIRVKGDEPVVEEVVVTRHGPIISSLAPHLVGEEELALRWTSLEPDSIVSTMLAMNRARDCLEFREALRGWTAPIQNIVYADTQGNIAYSFPGKVPVRAKGDGRVPVPGWTGEYEWTGYVPFDKLPHLYNPPRGFVATANNRVADKDYPHELGYDHCSGHRFQRIVQLLEAEDRIDVDYIQRMHFDQISLHAQAVARYLGTLQTDDPELEAVVSLVRDWDGELTADSAAAAVEQVFVRRMIARILDDKLGDLSVRYAGKGPTPVLGETTLFGHRSLEWLERVLEEPESHWFDLGGGETRDDVARLALRETADFLKSELGPDMKNWAWGKLHRLTYAHLMGRVKPLDKLFNRGPFALGGSGNTIWATFSNYHDLEHEVIVGPPFRFIADLSDLGKSLGMLVPGQSGQPASPHYDDQIEAWFEAGYHPMLYDRVDIVRDTKSWLELLPNKRPRRA